jgi:hypothetical protein
LILSFYITFLIYVNTLKTYFSPNVPEQRRENGTQRNDLAVADAEPPTGGEA